MTYCLRRSSRTAFQVSVS